MSTHPYEHTHTHHIPMSNSERLSQPDLEIHEVGHQERLTVNNNVASTERISSHKYNTNIKFKI
jgi:hypothetical protein